jgi:uncharacterized OB-fold protein
MAIKADYLGMTLTLDDLEVENLAYFGHCAEHHFHLQRCKPCNLLHYPPGTGCPWCGSADQVWEPVEGKGAVHAYNEVHHAIQPAFKPFTPYMVLLVDLDVQKGQPSEHEAIRVAGNLCNPDGTLARPEMVARVGIGTRVRMVFTDVAPGLSLPQWTIDEEAEQPTPWRYPE